MLKLSLRASVHHVPTLIETVCPKYNCAFYWSSHPEENI